MIETRQHSQFPETSPQLSKPAWRALVKLCSATSVHLRRLNSAQIGSAISTYGLRLFLGLMLIVCARPMLGQTVSLNFDSVDTSTSPNHVSAVSYLQTYGISVSNVSPPSASLSIIRDTAVYDTCKPGVAGCVVAPSEPNVLDLCCFPDTQSSTGSYTLRFSSPVSNVSFVRPEIVPGPSGIITPQWTATAYDSSGKALGSVGESVASTYSAIPAANFNLPQSGIASLVFSSNNNNYAALSNMPIDNLTFTESSSGLSWMRLSPTGSGPDARTDSSAIYDAGSNALIVFGGNDTGCTSSPSLNDTWLLLNADGLGGPPKWFKVSPIGGPPPVRRGQSAIYDPNTDRMVIFGGDPVGCAVDKYNDVWVLTDATGTHGIPAWKELSPAGGPPPARSDHTAIYDPASNRMTIAGGFGPDGNMNDVWVLAHANGLGGQPRWFQIEPSGAPPSPTGLRSATYDPVSNRMTVFGGWNCCSQPFFNETWVLTYANGLGGPSQWIQLQPSGVPPTPRLGASAVYDADANWMVVFGGSGTNEVWALSFANGLGGTPQWTQLHPTGTPPLPRGGSVADPAFAFDGGFGRMILFGGTTPTGLVNDVWVLSGLP